MPRVNEHLVRRTYAAFARGDMEGVLAECTDDVGARALAMHLGPPGG
jgi:ketosteroid isomerase-like protein